MTLRIAIAVLVIALTAAAQDATAPAKVLRIVRESVKPGRAAGHDRHEAGIARALARAKGAPYQLAFTSVTGAEEAWFLSSFDSFASLETSTRNVVSTNSEVEGLRLLDGDFLSETRTVLATYRPDLSYLPEEYAAGLPKTRFLSVAILRVQPGREREFVDMGKSMTGLYAKAKDPWPFVFYQVSSGMPNLTFLVFVATPSMAYLDDANNRARGLRTAVGDERIREINKQVAENVLASENLLLAVRAAMSFVAPGFASKDPGFWREEAPASMPSSTKPPASRR